MKTSGKSRPRGVWARLRRKRAEGAEWALCDARVGVIVFFAIYFGLTRVLLGLIGIDAVAGTSLHNLTSDWFIRAKFTTLGVGLVCCFLILAPAALLAGCLLPLSTRGAIASPRLRLHIAMQQPHAMGFET